MSAPSPVALVHDYLLVRRGAERTFEAIAECFPEAPIYTLLYDAEGTEGRFEHRDVRTSFLQRYRVGQTNFRRLLPVLPHAMTSLPVDQHQLIVSSSSAFAHAARGGGLHVCYCHSPFRYAWFETDRALGEVPAALRPMLRHTLWRVRAHDRAAAAHVTAYLANSALTRERIARYWKRESDVVHPPVEVDRFTGLQTREPPRPSFLMVGELVAHKRVDVALEAARLAKVSIQVVGEGPERPRLEAQYGGDGSVEFLGRVGDDELDRLYSSARALVLPNVEEFGIAAVEAQAAGRPVVATAAGGALETVISDETGVLVPGGDAVALARALAETDFDRFSTDLIVANAHRFSREIFKTKLVKGVANVVERPLRLAVYEDGPKVGAPLAAAG